MNEEEKKKKKRQMWPIDLDRLDKSFQTPESVVTGERR